MKVKNFPENNPNYYCPCCQLPTTEAAPLYPLCWNILELNDLGSGIPLYFYFYVFIGQVFFLMIFVVSIPCTIIICLQSKSEEWTVDDDPSYFSQLSLGSFGVEEDNYKSFQVTVLVIIHSLMIWLLYVSTFFFKNHQSKVIKKVDEK